MAVGMSAWRRVGFCVSSPPRQRRDTFGGAAAEYQSEVSETTR